jgi:hypothetical protein
VDEEVTKVATGVGSEMLIGAGGVLGALVAMIGKFILDTYNTARAANRQDGDIRFNETLKERAELASGFAQLRQDMQGQILELRSTVVKLQEDNLRYVRENAELLAKVQLMQKEIDELRTELEEERNRN